MTVQFMSHKKISYKAGQFVSLYVPNRAHPSEPLRRAYSFSSGPEMSKKKDIYELCVKHYKGGAGSTFLAALKAGDKFEITAPYGDFFYVPREGRNLCFISTGTGLAPFLSMIRSKTFQEEPPERAMCLFGAASEREIIAPREFEDLGILRINAISRPAANWMGFKGRVTDYLRSLPTEWPWNETDFYICGNPQMVIDVQRILQTERNVPNPAVIKEIYWESAKKLPFTDTATHPKKKAA